MAIGAHLVGGAQLLKANKGRVAGQKGVAASTVAKLDIALPPDVYRAAQPSLGGHVVKQT